MIKKIALILAMITLLICSFAGCGENKANSAIAGKWVGNNEDGIKHLFVFNPDGTGLGTIGDNHQHKFDFTYKSDGDKFLITVDEDDLGINMSAPTVSGSITIADVNYMQAILSLTVQMSASVDGDTLFVAYIQSSPSADADFTSLTLTKAD